MKIADITKGSKKGQLSFVNLIAGFISILLFFILLPVLANISDQTVAKLELNPNESTGFIVTLVYIAPVVVLLALLATIWGYAVPRMEGRY